ncbi:hypothetical protein AB205_0093780 [Aquarana catesbeiana]|uniref:Uncharacterized protein n=1 Tax=Aquarana catesbeiana TaxID=8400 RepID=A0A2G9Q821_AQUCT|nr:hypothetical protein AB205_0093780 [Aquarana catesbeiana]
MEEWYKFFNDSEIALLRKIVVRRQHKLKNIESEILQIKDQLLPFHETREYKDKENNLQEAAKKYDKEIQLKKQKKFKRDVLDYKNQQVYKWQTDETYMEEDLNISMVDDTNESIMEEDATIWQETEPVPVRRNTEGDPRPPEEDHFYTGKTRLETLQIPRKEPKQQIPLQGVEPKKYPRHRSGNEEQSTRRNAMGRENGPRIQNAEWRKRKRTRGKRGGAKKKKARVLGGGIFNLSEATFNEEEMKTLDLGLKYAPEKCLDPFEAYIDLQKFIRKLNIRKFFAMKGENKLLMEKEAPIYKHSQLKNNSVFNPNTQQNESLTTFKKMVEQDIRKLKPKKVKAKIWKTINEIEKKKNIIIRPADKGGGLVILNKKDYESEMEKLLAIPNTYKKLRGNPKAEYKKKLKAYIQKGEKKGILNKKESKFLLPEAAKTPVIYYVPKIHKNQFNP